MKKIHDILEVANTHGGDIKYIFSLLEEFEGLTDNFGIKFQPFKYDEISLKDFSWYPVYEKLFFDNQQWIEIIKKASETKKVWLDLFDIYGVNILKENLQLIEGVKFQASVLDNLVLLKGLSKVDLTNKKVIFNISGYELIEIQAKLTQLKKYLNAEEFIIQIGFQAYPTEVKDSGINKIAILRNEFKGIEISFTEHIDANDVENSTSIPIFAILQGAKYIEKHIKHSTLKTEYDFYSSVDYSVYSKYIEKSSLIDDLFNESFINDREADYLSKSLQVPILGNHKEKGSIISSEDLIFKRTNQHGINISQIMRNVNSQHILRTAKKGGEVLKNEDFKKATIATIIACRMKSTRLPKKAILNIGNISSIERCIKNVLNFSNVNYTILATSSLEEDDLLKKYTYSDDVIFHTGEPVDVIQRYIDVIDRLQIDVFIRVTGDCPYLSREVQEILLKAHFEDGADYTTAEFAAIGTNLEIFNSNVLFKIKEMFPNTDYSEYMTYYVTNNPEHFKINKVSLPEELICEHRLTLDYKEDLVLFNSIQSYLDENNLDYSLPAVIKFLDDNKDIADINKNCEVVYQSNFDLMERINKATTFNLK